MTLTEEPPAPAAGGDAAPTRGARRLRHVLAALAGLLAAAVALGVAELIAGLIGPAASPVVAVGDAAITLTPEALKSFAIEQFGENDKIVLVAGTLVVIALYALVVGLVSLRSRVLGLAGIALFGLIGVVAALTRPAGGPVDGLPSVVGPLVGMVALVYLIAPLLPAAGRRDAATAGTGAAAEPRGAVGTGSTGSTVAGEGAGDSSSAEVEPADRQHADEAIMARLREVLASGDRKGFALDRRRFVLTSGVAVGAAVVTGGGGRLLQRRFDVAGERTSLTLPTPADPAPALPADADLSATVADLTPLFTANSDFYRVDTAITVPQISPTGYALELTGMFDTPRSFTLQELFSRDDLIERDITLTCVSNEVGGRLSSTARWIGIPLGDFLREQGIQSGSDQLLCRSSDGMTIGTPTESALNVEDAMIAIGMNGEPLLVEHGFPVRMLIPGLYGYVSACKWMTGIQATTYAAVDAYWTERDWATDAPVKVFSRIDTPAALRNVPAGPTPVAGVAWAQGRGIARVEVRVDDADWVDAQLSPEVNADLWRQWVLPLDLAAGQHQFTVRATDTTGAVQDEERVTPFPDGATGWHSIRMVST